MKRRGFLFLAAVVATSAAETPTGPVVELPPMIIEESASLPPWLYVRAGDTEYLSRCTAATTRGYVEMRRSRMQWVRALFPTELLARSDVPGVTVLVSQSLKASNNAEVIGEVLQLRGAARPDGGYRRAITAPNMMLVDSDAVGVFAYIDEANFDRSKLTISSDYVRFLLARRTPGPPAWLIEGMMAAYNAVLFEETPITLAPLPWHSQEELRALAKDFGAPRTLVPMGELFAGDGGAIRHPKIAQVQSALLVRWALDPRNRAREGFWKFSALACEAPATEAMLQSCLGFGFSDLRDRLSDYLPTALRERLRLPLEKAAALPALEIRRAAPTEIARLRGEWERLAVPLVRQRHPDHGVRYLEQARRTLRRAYDSGERDPRLLASLGLCELDAGERVAARVLLENALAAGVVRPRAAYELARLRWADLVRGQPATRQFPAEAITPVIGPLRVGLDQAPPVAEMIELWADAWARTSAPPPEADVQRLLRGAQHFIAIPRVCLRVTRALGRHGRSVEAIELLGRGFLFVHDDATRAQFAQMFAALQRPSARKPE